MSYLSYVYRARRDSLLISYLLVNRLANRAGLVARMIADYVRIYIS